MLRGMILERYYSEELPFKCTLLFSWMESERFISFCHKHKEEIPFLTRLTLLSDGSLVRFLRALYLSDISVDVTAQREVPMGLEMAKFLDSRAGVSSIIRDAWLCCNGQRLVYAHSFIDASEMGEVIQKEINRKAMPVGMLLSDYNLPLIRDQLFITQFKSDPLAREFSVTENIFWARYYRLRGGDGFNAAILEVFSPGVFTGRQ
jgi:chorismate-pyruvate lyase